MAGVKGRSGRLPLSHPRYQNDAARARIQANKLIKRLERFALAEGKSKLSISEIRAIEILLRKCLPDLVQTDINANVTHRYVVEIPPMLSSTQWSEKYAINGTSPPMLEHHEKAENPDQDEPQPQESSSAPLLDLKSLRP
jgi:hypothetical protein